MPAKENASPAEKALWFIENRFGQPAGLEEIAAAAGVSRYHLARVFAVAFGVSAMSYLRGRRLTEAARALMAGAPDILAVALDAGYGSHEAFTRAFRERFGITPEAMRAQGSAGTIPLLEPIRMNQSQCMELAAPRIETRGAFLVAGLGERYDAAGCAAIPAQWQNFVPHLGHIPGQVGRATYGVLCNGDDAGNIDYIAGVEVADFARCPAEFSRLRVPEQEYAVFAVKEHVSTIRRAWQTIWNRGLPEQGLRPSGGPEFERYGEAFDGLTGEGGYEIWVPIKR